MHFKRYLKPFEFQSTPLREGRRGRLLRNYRQDLFQSTPLREGRLVYSFDKIIHSQFQSTPLREGRHKLSP